MADRELTEARLDWLEQEMVDRHHCFDDMPVDIGELRELIRGYREAQELRAKVAAWEPAICEAVHHRMGWALAIPAEHRPSAKEPSDGK